MKPVCLLRLSRAKVTILTCVVDLDLRVSVTWSSGKTAVGLVAWVRLGETSVETLTPTEAGARCEASVPSPSLALAC